MLRLATILLIFSLSATAEQPVVRVSVPDLEQADSGRLLLAFGREADAEPRQTIGWPVTPTEATPFFGMDVTDWNGEPLVFEADAGYPFEAPDRLPAGGWYVQALWDVNQTLSEVNAPGNFYSEPQAFDPSAVDEVIEIELTRREPPESLPEDRELLKFVRIRSPLLSAFYGREIHLRASVLLPAGYEPDSERRYPVLFSIGGLNARYDRSQRLWGLDRFREWWSADGTPQLVVVFLDGESPWGDSYQVNSEISGPYADANFEELFPYLAERFPIDNRPGSRFLTGCSTGGWVSMALQVFYPDEFNGAWSFSPDSPSFRAFQLVDLYEDSNAFVNEFGYQRPSMRRTDGEPVFSLAQEFAAESAMARGRNFLYSGQQWASWNAVYGQLDEAGEPIPVWDQDAGTIDPEAVAGWERWDIERHIRENWAELGPRLQGKLHFFMGDMDTFYLNVGLRMLEETIQELDSPRSDASFYWRAGHGHCGWGLEMSVFEVIEAADQRASR